MCDAGFNQHMLARLSCRSAWLHPETSIAAQTCLQEPACSWLSCQQTAQLNWQPTTYKCHHRPSHSTQHGSTLWTQRWSANESVIQEKLDKACENRYNPYDAKNLPSAPQTDPEQAAITSAGVLHGHERAWKRAVAHLHNHQFKCQPECEGRSQPAATLHLPKARATLATAVYAEGMVMCFKPRGILGSTTVASSLLLVSSEALAVADAGWAAGVGLGWGSRVGVAAAPPSLVLACSLAVVSDCSALAGLPDVTAGFGPLVSVSSAVCGVLLGWLLSGCLGGVEGASWGPPRDA